MCFALFTWLRTLWPLEPMIGISSSFFSRFMFYFSVTGCEAHRLFAYGFLWSFWHYVHSADPSYVQLKLLKQHFHDWGAQKPSSTKDRERVDLCLPALLERGAARTEAQTYCVYFSFYFYHPIAPSFLVFLCKIQRVQRPGKVPTSRNGNIFIALLLKLQSCDSLSMKIQIQSVHRKRNNTLHR